jgi:hypothetical protein
VLTLAAAIALPAGAAVAIPAETLEDRAFAILRTRCISCHGGVRERGDVNLSSFAWATRALPEGGAAIKSGDPAASRCLERIRSDDPDLRMPPDGTPLSREECDLLERWIRAGARFPEPWAMTPLADPPSSTVDAGWSSNPIDRAVAARLAAASIPLPAEAAPRALIRRAALDLTGLPPDPALVEGLSADPSPESWGRAVDALLASPAFGERWARVWLDLARYADTKGYEKDARREVWRFRDWLIDALNADMPYDRFTERVLAGDLVPGATDEDRVATAFHRLTLTNDEGGTDNEEFRVAAVMDRTATTWQAWAGTSMQCVQCHAHPYDAIDHREYYRAMAIFDQTADADRDDEQPVIPVAWARGQTTVPVMQELPADSRRTTRVFERGNWRSLGEAVEPGVPASFPACDSDEPLDRLAFARWLTGPAAARTARVEVNRVWETLFGRGIVETSEDFGWAGSGPDDRALLDALSRRLIELGWSRKALLREILLSRTYRMDAVPTAAALARDPSNRIPSRAPRFRLEAEAVRDQALAVSGLLDRTMHGPPVFPHQPDGVWMVVYSGDAWKTSEGGDRWRRAIYTFWRRSSPHPSLSAFDAVSRETCTVRRVRTNTPLAALAAINDPTFVEAARAFASRAIDATPGADDAARARWMLAAALVREPSADECRRIAGLVAAERAALAASPSDAASIAGAGPDDLERAAWCAAAAAILNLDEFLSRT